MSKIKPWHGVRTRKTSASPDPDSAPRGVILPAAWEDRAAEALAALAPGEGPVLLEDAAQGWIGPIAERAARAGLSGALGSDLATELHNLLIQRRGAPLDPIWRGHGFKSPGFVLNLPAFHLAGEGFDTEGFASAAAHATLAMALLSPASPSLSIGMTDLAGLLAGMGLDYDSDAARALAGDVARTLRTEADRVSALLADKLGTRHAMTTAIGAPSLAEALLGVETSGIAPEFSPLSDTGVLSRTARATLAARGMSAEAALAATLAGKAVFAQPGSAAHAAMHDAVAPYLQAMPARPVGRPLRPARGARCRRGAMATPRRPASAATSCSCVPANTPTARSARYSSACTRKARRSAA
jgi:ribonucleoside-diphosphate reductase alpha chain